MIRGFYTAATGMLVQRCRMDVITNNLVNAETTAYKADSLVQGVFGDLVLRRMNGAGQETVGTISPGTRVNAIVTSFAQGNPEQTGRACDFALNGNGFFVVSTPDGDRYTRNGGFSVTSDGYLINADGFYVQGRNGRIHVGSGGFAVDQQGNITVNGTITDKFRIVRFADLNALTKEGGSLFSSPESPAADTQTSVMQGYLESSNVDISGELTDMMAVTNMYSSNQQVLKMIDGTIDKAVNEVGRVF